jgi:hypothetical protein
MVAGQDDISETELVLLRSICVFLWMGVVFLEMPGEEDVGDLVLVF